MERPPVFNLHAERNLRITPTTYGSLLNWIGGTKNYNVVDTVKGRTDSHCAGIRRPTDGVYSGALMIDVDLRYFWGHGWLVFTSCFVPSGLVMRSVVLHGSATASPWWRLPPT
jgi:hypothetical protein